MSVAATTFRAERDGAAPEPARRERRGTELAWHLAAGLLALLAGALLAGTLSADYSIPLSYSGDAVTYQTLAKAMVDHGWYLHNPTLGAPGEQQWFDYPVGGDDIQLAGIKVLTLFVSSFWAANLWYLLGGPAIAIAAFWVLRRLHVSRLMALAVAVVYTMLPARWNPGPMVPGRLYPGPDHLFLTSYMPVPLAAWLVLRVYLRKPLFDRRPGARLGGWLTAPTVLTTAICLLLGAWDTYYAVFTMLLLALAGAIAAIGDRAWRRVIAPAVSCVIIAGFLVVNLAPSIAWRHEHGSDPQLTQRQRLESEYYGLTLANLVVPIDDHRVPPLAAAGRRYHRGTEYIQPPQPWTLGLLGSAGLLLLGIVLLGTPLARRPFGDERLRATATATGTAFLIATFGGVSALIAAYLSPQIRVYGRMSVFIAFFCLLSVALALDRLRPRLARRARWAFPALAAAVLVLGVLDLTPRGLVTQPAATRAEWARDSVFVTGIERQLGRHASLLQLPYVPYPENPPVGRMTDYDEERLALHSSTLRWSSGSMKGRPADWLAAYATAPTQTVLAQAHRRGFSGVVVDTFGYADSGAALLKQLRHALGPAKERTPDGRLVLFGLRR